MDSYGRMFSTFSLAAVRYNVPRTAGQLDGRSLSMILGNFLIDRIDPSMTLDTRV